VGLLLKGSKMCGRGAEQGKIGCGIADVKGAKLVGLLLYRNQIGCGIAAVKEAKCVAVLLYREQIFCGITAVKDQVVWDCCCKGSKMCGSAAVQAAK